MAAVKTSKTGNVLNILVLIGSIVIFSMLSFEIIGTGTLYDDSFIDTVQFIICLIFLTDYFWRFSKARNKVKFFFNNLIFLLVSIPYINILNFLNASVTEGFKLFLRTIPLIRGGYGLYLVVKWFVGNRVSSLFVTYLTILAAFIYFASLIFYMQEKAVNGMVKEYWDALWWALMDVTTVGSNIYAMTRIGQLLSVFLAALGMMMFPIFTVYITSRLQKKHKDTHPQQS